jgi:hypothetical protein
VTSLNILSSQKNLLSTVNLIAGTYKLRTGTVSHIECDDDVFIVVLLFEQKYSVNIAIISINYKLWSPFSIGMTW